MQSLWRKKGLPSKCSSWLNYTVVVDSILSEKSYIFRRQRYYNAHPKSTFDIEILPGIIAKFGEPKSKLNSKRYQLIQLSVNNQLYSKEMADVFWKRFNIVYVNRRKRGKKLPLIHRVVGSLGRPVRDGYVAVCELNSHNRETFVHQNSYEYWSSQFLLNSDLFTNRDVEKKALMLLINKVSANPAILKDIPTKTDWRLFEEIVAEIFTRFGFEVSLTKKTNDGGKDIIALRKESGGVVERLLIECKHWKDKIDVKPVRNLVGVAVTQDELPTGVILATTSEFNEGAKRIQVNPNILIKLDLKDYNDVLQWIGDYNAIQLSPKEIEEYFCRW